MVLRVENKGLVDFEGVVEDVEFETGAEGRRQYHIYIAPTSFEMKSSSKTKLMHEWIPLSPKSTEAEIPQGSVMDRYLQQVEIVLRDAKKAETVADALKLMIGKKFRFDRIKLGKDFEGHAAKEYIVPVALLA
jgi:hypothetical protein